MLIITYKTHLLSMFGVDGQRVLLQDPVGPLVCVVCECWMCGAVLQYLAPVVALSHGIECGVCHYFTQYPKED